MGSCNGLSSNPEKWEALLLALDEGVVIQDAEGRIANCNRSAERILGLSADRLTGLKLSDPLWRAQGEDGAHLPPEAHPTAVALRTGQPVTGFIMGLRRADGTAVWVSVNSRAVGHGRTANGAVTVLTDITSRRATAGRLEEERWQLAVEGARDGIWDWNVEKDEVFYSRRWVEILGHEQAEVSNTRSEWETRIHPDDRASTLAILEAHLQAKTPYYEAEYRLRCKDGSWKWLLARGAVVNRSADGSPLRFVGAQTDITERKQGIEALRTSEEKFAQLFRSSPVAMSLNDLEASDRLADVNAAFEQVTGYERSEVIGRTVKELKLWADPRRRDELFAQFIAGGSIRSFECRFRRKDGSAGTGLMSVDGIEIGGRRHILVSMTDITERKQAEEALAASETRYRTLFEAANDAVFVYGMNDDGTPGRFVAVNQVAIERLGFSAEEFCNMTPADVNVDRSPRSRADVINLIQTEGRATFESVHRSKDGAKIPVEVSSRRFLMGGRPFVLSIARDIAERKATEQALRERNDRLRALFNHQTLGVVITSPRKSWVEMNDTWCRMLGYSREELAAMDWPALTHPEDLATEIPQYDRLLSGDIERYRLVKRFVRKDGAILHAEISVSSVRAADGSLQHLICLATDVTERERSRKALHESEEKFKALFDNTPVASYLAFLESGRAEEVNPAFEQLFGWAREEVIGKTPVELGLYADPNDRHRVLAELEATGRVVTEVLGRKRSGETFQAALSFTLLRLRGQDHLLGTIRDITETRRAEASLRQNEARAKALVRISQHQSETVKDLLDYALEEALALTESRFGYIYTYDEDQRKFEINTWSKEVMHECAVADPRLCHELAETGAWGEAIRQRKAIVVNEFQKGHPSNKGYPEGHVTIQRFMTIPVFRRDRIIAVVGMANKEAEYTEADVLQLTLFMDGVWKSVEVRNSELKLRQAHERFLAIANCIPDAIWSMDLSGRFLYLSPSFERIYGWTIQEGLALSFRDTVTPVQADQNERTLRDLLERASAPDFDRDSLVVLESEERRKDGSTFWAEVSGSLIWADGKPVAITGVTRDITQRKRAEEERDRLRAQLAHAQRMESIGRLAGGIAHDFNNLLTVINGYGGLAAAQLTEGDPLREFVQQICRAGERAVALTRQLLAFSRKQIMQPAVLDLNAIVRGLQPMLGRLVGENIELVAELSADAPAVKADPHQLEQVIMNLAVNSRDAMPAGGRLRISTAVVEMNGNSRSAPEVAPGLYARLAVSDTGIGIEPAALERIFEPFFTTKGVGQGTGLGLSMVQGIITQSGGSVQVESEPGRGATFNVYLPALTRPVVPIPAQAGFSEGRGAETILVVEDDANVRAFTAAALRSYGYAVIEAASGSEALDICEHNHVDIDLVVTDVVMPGISGRELGQRLSRLYPRLKTLLMSGYTGDALDDEILHEVLPKPFRPDQLAAKIRQVLGPPPVVRGRIVVADDELRIRALLRSVLEGAGHRVSVACNGEEAVKQAVAEKADLVILDLVMPDQEGIETIQVLRKRAPGTRIIAISGAFGGQFLNVAEKLGAHAVMAKPLKLESVVSKVAELLRSPASH